MVTLPCGNLLHSGEIVVVSFWIYGHMLVYCDVLFIICGGKKLASANLLQMQ